jgi:hypothetical protein
MRSICHLRIFILRSLSSQYLDPIMNKECESLYVMCSLLIESLKFGLRKEDVWHFYSDLRKR